MPQPRLIDPAVFFDIVKIRRAVDEATEEAVRANSGVSNVGNVSRFDPFGGSQQPGSQMSKERIHRVRQKAVKLLAKAYTLDEVATSVVTMSSSSSLEDVAEHVLKRDKEDIDAKYVHFFHEKIPSRSMEEHTSLQPLAEIMQKMTWDAQAAPLRTRGLVRIMKNDLEGATEDFSYALRIAQEVKKRHKPSTDQLVLARDFKKAREQWERNPKSIPQLKDDEQPTSMEQQLLFNRAGVYLSLACNSVHDSLQGLEEYMRKSTPQAEAGVPPEISPKEAQEHAKRLEARKRVKTYAKRAWKDYMSFLAFFDYTPGYPVEVTQTIMQRVYDIANGSKSHSNGHHDDTTYSALSSIRRDALTVQNDHKPPSIDLSSIPPPKVYSADALFASQPLPDLPPFPAPSSQNLHHSTIPGVREALTYHPLLPDALHSLLLTHCLLQTSPTELQRHAHSAARLSRIADGYPIFQPPRSPARADWIEVLRKCENWIKLGMSWGEMCRPVHHGGGGAAQAGRGRSSGGEAVRDGAGQGAEGKEETSKERRERIKKQAIADALGDERVVDEETFRLSVAAREKRAERDEVRDKALFNAENGGLIEDGGKGEGGTGSGEKLKRWAEDEALKEYPVTTERVEAVARWVREAPGTMPGGGRKKKRPAGKGRGKVKTDGGRGDGVVQGVQGLKVEDGEEGEEEGPD